jgi:hypothetical protein
LKGNDVEFVVDYELTRAVFERGLTASTRFRRQLLLLATLSLPALFTLTLWPQFRWWMVPPVIALLAFRAYRVPQRVARHTFKDDQPRNGSLRLNDSGIVATGVVEADAPWANVVAFDESEESFQIQVSRGPVVVLPKSPLSPHTLESLAGTKARVPAPSERPLWALLLVSLALAVALFLRLR